MHSNSVGQCLLRWANLTGVIWALSCLAAVASAGDSNSVSRWQHSALAPPVAETPVRHDHDYLMLDTGGSGGMFGKGDIRRNLRSVDFWSKDIGWAVGDAGVFRTVNGGISWQRVKERDPAPAIWSHVALKAPDDVWLLQYFHGQPRARLFRSRDGGTVWDELLAGKLRGAKDIQVKGPKIWVLCGDYPSYVSADNGASWSVERFGGLLHGTFAIAVPGDVRLLSGYVVYVLGHFKRQLRLIKSEDSGRHWSVVDLPKQMAASPWQIMNFPSSLFGVIGLADGTIWLSRDGGEQWQQSVVVPQRRITALWVEQSGLGFAALANGERALSDTALLRTDDAGMSWTPVYRGKVQFNAIDGSAAGRLWAVGNVPGIHPNDAVLIIDRVHRPADGDNK